MINDAKIMTIHMSIYFQTIISSTFLHTSKLDTTRVEFISRMFNWEKKQKVSRSYATRIRKSKHT